MSWKKNRTREPSPVFAAAVDDVGAKRLRLARLPRSTQHMDLLLLTDDDLEAMRRAPKVIVNPRVKWKEKGAHRERNFQAFDERDATQEYQLFLRVSTTNPCVFLAGLARVWPTDPRPGALQRALSRTPKYHRTHEGIGLLPSSSRNASLYCGRPRRRRIRRAGDRIPLGRKRVRMPEQGLQRLIVRPSCLPSAFEV